MILEIDWDNSGLYDASDSDVSAFIFQVDTSRGSRQLERRFHAETGRLRVRLDNSGKTLTRLNTYNSSIEPLGKLIRFTLLDVLDSSRQHLWTGRIDDVALSTRDFHSFIDLEATGLLQNLENQEFNLFHDSGTPLTTIVNDIFSQAGMTAPDFIVETLDEYHAGIVFTGSALQALKELEKLGLIFMFEDSQGRIIVKGRLDSYQPSSSLGFTLTDYTPTDVGITGVLIKAEPSTESDVINSIEVSIPTYTTESTAELKELWKIENVALLPQESIILYASSSTNAVQVIWDPLILYPEVEGVIITAEPRGAELRLNISNILGRSTVVPFIIAQGKELFQESTTLYSYTDPGSVELYGEVSQRINSTISIPSTGFQNVLNFLGQSRARPNPLWKVTLSITNNVRNTTIIKSLDVGDSGQFIDSFATTGIQDIFITFLQYQYNVDRGELLAVYEGVSSPPNTILQLDHSSRGIISSKNIIG